MVDEKALSQVATYVARDRKIGAVEAIDCLIDAAAHCLDIYGSSEVCDSCGEPWSFLVFTGETSVISPKCNRHARDSMLPKNYIISARRK